MSGAVHDVELRFPASTRHLALVRLVVTTVAEIDAELPPARLDDLRLAVSEACANAVEAYRRRRGEVDDATVVVRCATEPGSVTVEVTDRAGGFDLGGLVEHPSVTAPERLDHESGLGVPLMQALADVAEFRHVDGGTTVRLVLRDRRDTTGPILLPNLG